VWHARRVTAVDAETYLRCRLEDALIAGPSFDHSRLVRQVSAALAVGAVDASAADQVLADAARAAGLRFGDSFEGGDFDNQPKVARTIACPTRIEQEWGTLVITHVTLGEHETVIGASGVLKAASPRRHHRREPWEELEVIDAAGGSRDAHFSGGSSGSSFDGQFQVHPALDPTSTFVTIAGYRVDLVDRPGGLGPRIESLEDLTPDERARRHLDLLSSSSRPGGEQESVIARETLADLGFDVPAEDARQGAHPTAHAAFHAHSSTAQKSASRWLAIGATTPTLDGVSITLNTLSDSGEMSCTGNVSGRLQDGSPYPMARVLAEDDLGQHYTSHLGQGGGGGGNFHGTLQLVPTLNPAAKMLTFVIDTLCHRVLVDVPLEWPEMP
jgi:hypothetical protein